MLVKKNCIQLYTLTEKRHFAALSKKEEILWKKSSTHSLEHAMRLLTLFQPAKDGISPYMSVTWPSPVGIGLISKNMLWNQNYYIFSQNNSWKCSTTKNWMKPNKSFEPYFALLCLRRWLQTRQHNLELKIWLEKPINLEIEQSK